uniref:Uncharacterized protein n=1 Tax=Acrobeloides nanus TaxID=290746 RepID=A0A914CYY3_9BILA
MMKTKSIVKNSIPSKESAEQGPSSTKDPFEDAIKSLKEAGSDAMGEGRYWDAIDNFSLALFYVQDANVLANRSLAYLELEKYYFSYIDANEALKLKEDFAEALLIKALALCGLKYYTEARECLDACLELDPTKMNAKLTKFSITKLEDDYQLEPDKLVGYDPHEADSPRLMDLLTGGLSELNLADTESDTSEEQSEDEEYENGTYVYHDEDEDNTQSDIAAMYGDGCSSMGDIHEFDNESYALSEEEDGSD